MNDESAMEETCRLCGKMATHKVEEVLPDGEKRHPYSNYLCCHHFGIVLGPGAERYCKSGHNWVRAISYH